MEMSGASMHWEGRCSSSASVASNKLITASCVCLIFMIIEAVAGFLANSLAIMTDASHLLSDLCSYLISLFAIWVSNKKGSIAMSFGYRRAEILGALMSVLFIWFLTATLIFQATKRFLDPPTVNGRMMFIVALIGTLANIFMTHILKMHSHGIGGIRTHSHIHSVKDHWCNHMNRPIRDGNNYVNNQLPNKGKSDNNTNSNKSDHSNNDSDINNNDIEMDVESSKGGVNYFTIVNSRNSNEINDNHYRKLSIDTDDCHEQSHICQSSHDNISLNVTDCNLKKHQKTSSLSKWNEKQKISQKWSVDINSRQLEVMEDGENGDSVKSTFKGICSSNSYKFKKQKPYGLIEAGDVYYNDHNSYASASSISTQDNENINLKAAYIHAVGDLLQNIGVMIASALIWWNSDWRIADPVCTIIFSFFVLLTTASIIKEATNVLMEGTPIGLDIKKLQNDLLSIEGVVEVHDLHVWSISLGKPSLACHVVIDNEDIARRILRYATAICQKKYHILHTTIQTDFSINKSCCDTEAHKKCFEAISVDS